MSGENKESKALAIPMMPIAELTKLTAFVNDVKKTLMVEGQDYVIQGNKQYTSRSGFAKLAQGFNLSDEILKEEALIKEGEFFGFNFTMRVFNDDGRQATGVGSCTMDEPNIQKSHKERPYHDVRSIAFTRALNRAVSNFVGSAEVSAEEMSLGSDFDRREVDSQQTFPLPESFNVPTWDFEEALRAEGWSNLPEAFNAWVGDAGLNAGEIFNFVKEELRAIVTTRVYFGDNFGDICRMLDGAGFTWRKAESRWVLMKPAEVE